MAGGGGQTRGYADGGITGLMGQSNPLPQFNIQSGYNNYATPNAPSMQYPQQGQPNQPQQGANPPTLSSQLPSTPKDIGGPDVSGNAPGENMGFDKSGSDAGVGGQPVNQMQTPMQQFAWGGQVNQVQGAQNPMATTGGMNSQVPYATGSIPPEQSQAYRDAAMGANPLQNPLLQPPQGQAPMPSSQVPYATGNIPTQQGQNPMLDAVMGANPMQNPLLQPPQGQSSQAPTQQSFQPFQQGRNPMLDAAFGANATQNPMLHPQQGQAPMPSSQVPYATGNIPPEQSQAYRDAAMGANPLQNPLLQPQNRPMIAPAPTATRYAPQQPQMPMRPMQAGPAPALGQIRPQVPRTTMQSPQQLFGRPTPMPSRPTIAGNPTTQPVRRGIR